MSTTTTKEHLHTAQFKRQELWDYNWRVEEAVRNGNCTGDIVWPSLWSQTVSHVWSLHTTSYAYTFMPKYPSVVIWLYTADILIAFGQEVEISMEAGTFNRWMMPSLLAYDLLQCLNRFLQMQNNVLPMTISSLVIASLHIGVCWVFIFKLGLGSRGAALGNTISNRNNMILLAIYMKLSPSCVKTWTGFTGFVKPAVPSAVMICFKYWSFEMVVFLSGLLPNPKLETSVLSISLNACWMVCMISVSLGGAISTRVSNELGVSHAAGASLALQVMIAIAITEGAIIGIGTSMVRHIWGKLYSNEEEVIACVAKIMPLLTLSDFLDGF